MCEAQRRNELRQQRRWSHASARREAVVGRLWHLWRRNTPHVSRVVLEPAPQGMGPRSGWMCISFEFISQDTFGITFYLLVWIQCTINGAYAYLALFPDTSINPHRLVVEFNNFEKSQNKCLKQTFLQVKVRKY